jgi:hypothetical protein
VFAPTVHVLTLSHKAFACLAKESRFGTGIALHLPNKRRVLPGETEDSEKALSYVIQNDLYDDP